MIGYKTAHKLKEGIEKIKAYVIKFQIFFK